MSPQEIDEKQQTIFALADKVLDKELANGAPFSEELCNWATHQAEQTLGSVQYS